MGRDTFKEIPPVPPTIPWSLEVAPFLSDNVPLRAIFENSLQKIVSSHVYGNFPVWKEVDCFLISLHLLPSEKLRKVHALI